MICKKELFGRQQKTRAGKKFRFVPEITINFDNATLVYDYRAVGIMTRSNQCNANRLLEAHAKVNLPQLSQTINIPAWKKLKP
jgi:hypothetical protein